MNKVNIKNHDLIENSSRNFDITFTHVNGFSITVKDFMFCSGSPISNHELSIEMWVNVKDFNYNVVSLYDIIEYMQFRHKSKLFYCKMLTKPTVLNALRNFYNDISETIDAMYKHLKSVNLIDVNYDTLLLSSTVNLDENYPILGKYSTGKEYLINEKKLKHLLKHLPEITDLLLTSLSKVKVVK